MCDKCDNIDRQLFNFRLSQDSVDDKFALILLADTISDLEAQKIDLHSKVNPEDSPK